MNKCSLLFSIIVLTSRSIECMEDEFMPSKYDEGNFREEEDYPSSLEGELGDFEWNEDEKIPPKDVSSEEWSEFLNTLKKPILETASERVGPISVTNNGFRSLQIENSNLEEEEDCDIILKNKEIDKISNTIVNIVAKVQFASTSSEACNVFLSLDENRRIEILEMLNLTETFLNDFYDAIFFMITENSKKLNSSSN
ncbi:uncharacterized protein [Lepeophtheirus salmonis]|uniref:uncharacterized protein isoform X3 n=1 Tax=Lepeophtheirus salmonis TaxID=72036 RepID=UPI003AF36772